LGGRNHILHANFASSCLSLPFGLLLIFFVIDDWGKSLTKRKRNSSSGHVSIAFCVSRTILTLCWPSRAPLQKFVILATKNRNLMLASRVRVR
jgi:hypothetical protein